MERFVDGHHGWSVWIVMKLFALLTVLVSPWDAHAWDVHAGGAGLEIKIKAENHSTVDTPFCGVGGGLRGDRLIANVFTDHSGITTGTATYKPANGPAIELKIDQVISFCCGGIALYDTRTSNTIAIWLDDNFAPVHVNVEAPRNCENTRSTFTAGVDKLKLAIEVTDNHDDDDW